MLRGNGSRGIIPALSDMKRTQSSTSPSSSCGSSLNGRCRFHEWPPCRRLTHGKHFSLVSFFLIFLSSSFLMISRGQIISGSAGPIFATFSPNESVLGVDYRSDVFFRYLNGRCHDYQFCEKMANSALSSLWHSETEWDNAVYMHD